MKVLSGDAIEVKVGNKTTRGFALSSFDTDEDPTDFELRIIGKKDAIGEVVSFNSKDNITFVDDENYQQRKIKAEGK